MKEINQMKLTNNQNFLVGHICALFQQRLLWAAVNRRQCPLPSSLGLDHLQAGPEADLQPL